MIKLGILVGENNWTFFREVYEDLSAHFQTEIYRPKTYNTPLLHGRLNRWAYHSQIEGMLRRNDVCFFEWASDLLVVASHMPKRAAIVTRLHSFELYEWSPKINWDAVDRIILVSQAMRRQFADLYPQQAHKAEVVYNGQSLDAFKPPAQRVFERKLGMLCNIRPIKRIYEVVLTVHSLKEQGCDTHLHVAGEPVSGEELRYAAALSRLVEKLDLLDNISFDGYVVDTPTWLQGIDIFISNSYWEGQQVALIEAMATGCYCLSHFWDGAEEVLPAENLYATENELAQKIIEHCSQTDRARQKRQDLMRSIAGEKFDSERQKIAIRKVVDEVLSVSRQY